MRIVKVLKSVLIVGVMVYIAAAATMFFIQKRFIYVPTVGAGAPETYGLSGVAAERIATKDGETVEIWTARAEPGQPTIAYFHGNGGNLAHRAGILAMFREKGYGIVALDYRGYGNSTGSPSEEAIYADARLTLDHARDRLGAADRQIVLYGESLGTGVATQMATERPVAALVLQSAYTSVAEAAGERFPWLPVSLLLTERFSNIDRIAAVKAPVLILHGERDGMFPVAMAKALLDAATSAGYAAYFPEAGHNDMDVATIGSHLEGFVAAVVPPLAP